MTINLKRPGNLKNIVIFSGKTQENFISFCRKAWKTQGKCKICDKTTNENVVQFIFLS